MYRSQRESRCITLGPVAFSNWQLANCYKPIANCSPPPLCYTFPTMADPQGAPQAGGQGQQGQQKPAGPPPPRPGEIVPQGGLDPTQVFATPPPPPKQGGQPAVQDKSPPPPPPGTPTATDADKAALKAKGYDDEDIKILVEVGDYRFASIMATLNNDRIAVPEHTETKFDEQKFLTLLRGSISLTRDEKWRIIQAIPKLSQFQIDELQKIFDEEKFKFTQLSPKHLKHLRQLEQKHAMDWQDLQSLYVQQEAKKHEESQADDIRKQLGL